MNLDLWHQRADSGDSQFAIALGLIAIADAVTAFGIKQVEAINIMSKQERPESLDAKFDTLIAMVEQKFDPPVDDPPSPKRSIFGWRKDE